MFKWQRLFLDFFWGDQGGTGRLLEDSQVGVRPSSATTAAHHSTFVVV